MKYSIIQYTKRLGEAGIAFFLLEFSGEMAEGLKECLYLWLVSI